MKVFYQALCCCSCFFKQEKKDSLPNDNGIPLIDKSNKKHESNHSTSNNCPSYSLIQLPFSKEHIIKTINIQLSDIKNYVQFYSKNNLTLSMKANGSEYSSQFPVIKMIQYIKKTDLPSNIQIKDLCKYMNTPTIRIKWDKTIKEFEIIKHEDDSLSYILHTVLNKPVFFISERDLIVQRYDFFDNDIFYFIAQSTTEENIPEKPNIIRIDVIYNAYKIHEENDMFCFSSLVQMDFKMSLPQSIYNVTMPATLHQWFKLFTQKINEDHQKTPI